MIPTTNFTEALGFQTQHLKNWESKLRPELFKEISDYVVSSNDEAKGRCYRGQDIVQIILEWPNLSPCYATPVERDVI
jgi:hypothetical protein